MRYICKAKTELTVKEENVRFSILGILGISKF
jgi:hypothetical protein